MRRCKKGDIILFALVILCAGCWTVWITFVRHGSPSSPAEKSIDVQISGQKCTLAVQRNFLTFFSETGRQLEKYQPEAAGNRIVDCCVCDLDENGTDDILLILGAEEEVFGNTLLFLSPEIIHPENSTRQSLQVHTIFEQNMEKLKPWKIQTAHVDGDPRKEISVGVCKTARLHPVMAKRPFIYYWENGGLTPKWLGSRLSRPFDDYIFVDMEGDGLDELVSIEHAESGNKLIAAYRWKGFGFEESAESSEFPDLLEIYRGRYEREMPTGLIAKFKNNRSELCWGFFRQRGDVISLEKEISEAEAKTLAD